VLEQCTVKKTEEAVKGFVLCTGVREWRV